MAKSNAERQAEHRKRLTAQRITDHDLRMLITAAYYVGQDDAAKKKTRETVAAIYDAACDEFMTSLTKDFL